MERFFDLGDVELFKPKSTNAEEAAEEESDADVKDMDEDFGIDNPFLRKEIAEKTVEDVQKMRYTWPDVLSTNEGFLIYFLIFRQRGRRRPELLKQRPRIRLPGHSPRQPGGPSPAGRRAQVPPQEPTCLHSQRGDVLQEQRTHVGDSIYKYSPAKIKKVIF